MIGKKGHDSRAIANVFVDFAQTAQQRLSILQMLRFVYIAHGWTLGHTGNSLIRHPVEVWKHGPVIRKAFDSFHDQGVVVKSHAENFFGRRYRANLSDTENQIVRAVYDQYSVAGLFKLSSACNGRGTPWSRCGVRYYDTIPNDDIRDYYRAVIAETRKSGSTEGIASIVV